MLQPKWKSWGAWASTIALALFVLQNFFDIKIPKAEELTNLIYLLGMGWGIWNNPQRKDGY